MEPPQRQHKDSIFPHPSSSMGSRHLRESSGEQRQYPSLPGARPSTGGSGFHDDKQSRTTVGQQQRRSSLSESSGYGWNPLSSVHGRRDPWKPTVQESRDLLRDRSSHHCATTTPPRSASQDHLVSPPMTHRVTSSTVPFKYPPQNGPCCCCCSANARTSCYFPEQSRYETWPRSIMSMSPYVLPPPGFHFGCCTAVGNPKFRIYKLRLPPTLMGLLEPILAGCESFVARRLDHSWKTNLFSLTKQDIPLQKIPLVYQISKPIVEFVEHAIMHLYGVRAVHLDKNQPHVLKYSAKDGHTGVELHHDKSHVTVNISMSKRNEYGGGGTYFAALKETVKLDYGEFLLHPGRLVHGGVNITHGTRYLMVMFAQVSK